MLRGCTERELLEIVFHGVIQCSDRSDFDYAITREEVDSTHRHSYQSFISIGELQIGRRLSRLERHKESARPPLSAPQRAVQLNNLTARGDPRSMRRGLEERHATCGHDAISTVN